MFRLESSALNNFSILDVLPLPLYKVDIVDVGARLTEEPRYGSLLTKNVARLLGFEAEESQLEILEQNFPGHKFIQAFVGDGSEREFYTCFFGGCSSFYIPDPNVINRFTGMSTAEGSHFQVVSKDLVKTTRLDDFAVLKNCDFLKIDVQGSELDVLNGAKRVLGDTLVVELEVEFVPIYKNQPLFADIDSFMRKEGFFFHKFVDMAGRGYRPFAVGGNRAKPVSQMLWADAIYIRDFSYLNELDPDSLLKMAVLLFDLYTSMDLSANILAEYDNRKNTQLQDIFLDTISKKGVNTSFISIKDWSD